MARIKRKWKRISFVVKNKSEAGDACILWLLRYYNGFASQQRFVTNANRQKDSDSIKDLLRLAKTTGFDVECWQAGFDALDSILHPVILVVNEPELGDNSYMVLCKVISHKTGISYMLYHPMKGMLSLPKAELEQLWLSKIFLSMDLVSRSSAALERKKTWKWILDSITGKWPLFILSVLANVIKVAAGIILFFIVISLIDLWPHNNALPIKTLITISALMLTILFSEILHKNLKNVTTHLHFSNQLNNFTANIFNSSTGILRERVNESLLSRYLDITASKIQLFTLLHLSFSATVILLIISSYLSLISLQTVSCLFALTLIIYLITDKMKGGITNKQLKLSMHRAALVSSFNTMLESMSTIKTSNRESEFLLKANKRNYDYLDQLYNLKKLQNKFDIIKGLAFFSVLFSILIINLLYLQSGELLPGQFLALMALALLFSFTLNNLSSGLLKYHEIKTAHFNANFDLQAPPVKAQKKSPSLHLQDLESVEIYTLGNDTHYFKALKGKVNYFHFDDMAQRLDLVSAFDQFKTSENFEIIVNNVVRYQEIELDIRKKSIAVVLSEPFIFNDSIAGNIAFSDVNHIQEAVLNFIFKYGLDNYVKRFPESLATIIGTSGYELEIRDKIIIAIARALYRGAGLLIIDEVFLGIEEYNQDALNDFLDRIKDDIIVIVLAKINPDTTFCLKENSEKNKPGSYE
ncbi:hypothetical protein AY601_3535 [Pedobacter cryoconitis]|uniref:ABC-type bacteriocin/lantibiotic exporter with double-glycine peptidase domain n=1 Tax=Pedobacter cryoconitis TaxID=188932 RepID=A0A127VGJ8_9SPHI|nr:cysteine peptidase family C39 domain-containing protein [Pedobacter cryoconitis]AMQ00400.1 hypothetical protein AY601_3535 [Pedobacter cryoconitis]